MNDPDDFKVYRAAEGNPQGPRKWRRLRRGLADGPRRVQVSRAANNRYLEKLAAVESSVPVGSLASKISVPASYKGKRARALNPSAPDDVAFLEAINRGEFAINGFRNRDLRALLFPKTPKEELRRIGGVVTRRIRLLRAHRLVRRVPRTHRYTLTESGRTIILAILAARAADVSKLTKAA